MAKIESSILSEPTTEFYLCISQAYFTLIILDKINRRESNLHWILNLNLIFLQVECRHLKL